MAGVTQDKKTSRSGRREKPFQPAIGTDFGQVDEVEARTRGFLTRLIALALSAGLAVTGGYGLVTNNYMAVTVVWSVAAPIVGGVMTFYFGLQRNDTG